METLPIELTEMVSAVMAMMVVLIPVFGLVVRLAAKPVVEALLAARGEGARPADLEALKTRIEALEHEVMDLTGRVAAPALPDPRPIPLRP